MNLQNSVARRTVQSNTPRPARLGAVALVALALSIGVAGRHAEAQSPIVLNADTSSWDGMAWDIAAQAQGLGSGGVGSGSKRAWLAQGRTRAAVRLLDRQRVLAEDKTFSSITGDTSKPERPIALEVDDANSKLYTLTDAGLYRESITDPAAPSGLAWLDLRDKLDSTHKEELLDLKLSPLNDGFAIVLTSYQILVVEDVGAGLVVHSQATELRDRIVDADPQNNWLSSGAPGQLADMASLKVNEFHRLRIMLEITGGVTRVEAFVDAYADGFLAVTGVSRPSPRIIVGCLLKQDGSDNWVAPSFYAPTTSPIAGQVVYYNPIGKLPSQNPTLAEVEANKALCHDTFVDGGRERLAVGCPQPTQVRVVEVADCFFGGVVTQQVATHSFIPSTGAREDILGVFVDLYRTKRLFVTTKSAVWTHAWTEDSNFQVATQSSYERGETMAKGPMRDMAEVIYPSLNLTYTMWTTVFSTTDYVAKVFKVTSASQPPERTGQFYNMSSNDGGVINVGLDTNGLSVTDAYLPTFGGLVRYRYNTAKTLFEPASPSYLPAIPQSGPGGPLLENTEFISLVHVNDPLVQNPLRVLTVSGTGAFLEWQIDLSKNPLPSSRVLPEFGVPALGYPPATTWTPSSGPFYSNDIAVIANGNGQWVLTDLTNFDYLPGDTAAKYMKFALLAYQFDEVSDHRWEHKATGVVHDNTSNGLSYALGPSAALTAVVDIHRELDWAIVGHDMGFASFDIRGLKVPGAEAIGFGQNVSLSGNQSVNDDKYGTSAVAHVRVSSIVNIPVFGRVFVFANQNPLDSNKPALHVYAFDEGTGWIGDSSKNPIRTYKMSDIEAMGYPTQRLSRGVRMRFRQFPGQDAGKLYLCTESDVLRFAYDPDTDPDSLTLEAYFPNAATDGIHDCAWYSLPQVGAGLKQMVVRDREGFSIIPAE